MDHSSEQTLIRLLRTQRVASLGTLRDGGPLVSQVLFAAAPDFSMFCMHISRLAQHTQDILSDPRVSLMIADTDDGAGDPLQLARVSIRGEAAIIAPGTDEWAAARAGYLAKFPQAAVNFQLGDFALYGIEPRTARYVAGFGKAFNLRRDGFLKLALSAVAVDGGDAKGRVRYEGVEYESPSGACQAASSWKSCNGWAFWRYQDRTTGQWRAISNLRDT